MNKNHVRIILFVASIIFVILYHSLFSANSDALSYFVKVIAISGAACYIGVYLTYVILVKKFKELKQVFYDMPVFIIRKAIDGNPNYAKDYFTFYIVSGAVNFFSLYFLSITPISSLLSKFFEFEFTDKSELNFTVFNLNDLTSSIYLELIFAFTIIGVIILYVLRCIRRRDLNRSEKKYPEAKGVLAFCYTMLTFLLIQNYITNPEMTPNFLNNASSQLFAIEGLSLLFSLMSFFGALVVTLVDRLLMVEKPSQQKS